MWCLCKIIAGTSFGHEMRNYDSMVSECIYFGQVHIFESMFNCAFVCVYLFLFFNNFLYNIGVLIWRWPTYLNSMFTVPPKKKVNQKSVCCRLNLC